MGRCTAIKPNGERCKGTPIAGSEWCWNHSPEHAEAQRRAGSRGGKRGGRGRPLTDVADIKKRLSDLANDALQGTVETRVAAVVSQVLNVLLRAVTVELQVREQQELIQRLEELEQALEDRKGRHRRYG
jgi:hypothetical protein